MNNSNSSSNILNLDDLFDIKTTVIRDFPRPGTSRTIRFREVSVVDGQKRLRVLTKLQKVKNEAQSLAEGSGSISPDAFATLEEIQKLSASLISKYILNDKDEPLISEEKALDLSPDVVNVLIEALTERNRTSGEDSAPMETTATSSAGSIDSVGASESGTSIGSE